jgi:hypothetical protein
MSAALAPDCTEHSETETESHAPLARTLHFEGSHRRAKSQRPELWRTLQKMRGSGHPSRTGRAECFHCHPSAALANDGLFSNGSYVDAGGEGQRAVTGRPGDLPTDRGEQPVWFSDGRRPPKGRGPQLRTPESIPLVHPYPRGTRDRQLSSCSKLALSRQALEAEPPGMASTAAAQHGESLGDRAPGRPEGGMSCAYVVIQ